MEISILASSSSGNSIALRSGTGIYLLDAGLSGKQIEQRLHAVGWTALDIRGILVSHEHTDHVKGAGVLARRYKVPVFGTAATLDACAKCWRGAEDLRVVVPGTPFAVGDLECEPFAVPHDVCDPVQYVIRNNGVVLGVATDLGKVTTLVARKLLGCDVAIIEANHEDEWLRWGDYPWAVKQRISGPHGHLSNRQAAELAVQLAHGGVRHIVLAHLSPNHNDVETARSVVEEALADEGLTPELTTVGPADRPVVVRGNGTPGEDGAR